MGNDGNKPLAVVPPGLATASGAFGNAASIMEPAMTAYDSGAKATGNPFGMVEGASDQLAKDYGTFYDSVTQQIQYMVTALRSATSFMKTTETNYVAAETANTLKESA